jgi:FtsP/CotA-like multicopper oxidase with cupredoxin domain
MNDVSRRTLLFGALGLAGVGAAAACSAGDPTVGGRTFGPITASPGRAVVDKTLTPRPTTLDLGGPTVSSWAYDADLPGPLIRATAGDLIRVRVNNQLAAETTVHWHGIALRNDADGVPGMTQQAISAGATYTYQFVAPDPGTYFYHPHVGVQLDRGLYGPLIIDDPHEPGGYDAEWVVVIDDWLDGTGTTPDDTLKKLLASAGTGAPGGMDGMSGMDPTAIATADTTNPGMPGMPGMAGMGSGASPFGDAGDVTYPYYLINGRVAAAPDVLAARPGQRLRIRVINAGADTIFKVALGGHQLTVTHTDGWPVTPAQTEALYLGMGERADLLVTLGDGVFPLVAQPVGKQGHALALIRTGAGSPPPSDVQPSELSGAALLAADLTPAPTLHPSTRTPDAQADLTLAGQMSPYQWAINGAPFGQNTPIPVSQGQRLRIRIRNQTMMAHPVHVHGHTFALATSGLRKDTVMLRPMQALDVDLDANNVGTWAAHCHNIYHAEAGMMIALQYTA